MSTVLSPPRPAVFTPPKQPTGTISPASHTAVSQFTQVLCGGGLVVYGLLRGSWLGLTIAAAGGLLLYRGLAPFVAPADHRRLPPLDGPEKGAGHDWSPTVILPPIDGAAQMGPEVGGFADRMTAAPPVSFLATARSEDLTQEEHGEAEVTAYYRAMRRGGGRLPPFEHAKAIEDFCWAAEIVVRQRAGG